MTFIVHPVPGPGAEDVVSPDGQQVRRVAHTGGRPMGLEIFEDGDLLVCDARRGLLVVHEPGGDATVETLTTSVDGVPMRFAGCCAATPTAP
jgi:hypothetical protein